MNINTIKNAGIVTAKVAISAVVAAIAGRCVFGPINRSIQSTYSDNISHKFKQWSITKSIDSCLDDKKGICSFLSVLSTSGSFIGTYKALNWLEHKIIGKSDNIEQSENDALSISAEDEIEAAGVESDYEYAENL